MQSWTETRRHFHDYIVSSGKSEGTANTYCYNLSLFWRWCAKYEVTPYEVDSRLVRTWSAERQTQVTKTRVHNELAALRLFFKMLMEYRDRDDDPTTNVNVAREKRLPTEPLDKPELDAILAACTDERDRMLVLMLAHSGLRISEIASLRAEHIDWIRGRIKVFGKGAKERSIAPNPEIMNRLHAFAGMFPEGPIFVSKQGRALAAHQMRKIIYGLAARAKLSHIHPHRFRSLFATTFVEQFADIQALQGMMGHENIQTTARYAEYTKMRRGQDYMRRLAI